MTVGRSPLTVDGYPLTVGRSLLTVGRWLGALALVALALPAAGQTSGETTAEWVLAGCEERTVAVASDEYRVEYAYLPCGMGMVPATCCEPEPAHYDARVVVLKRLGGADGAGSGEEYGTWVEAWRGEGQYSEPFCDVDTAPGIYIERARKRKGGEGLQGLSVAWDDETRTLIVSSKRDLRLEVNGQEFLVLGRRPESGRRGRK